MADSQFHLIGTKRFLPLLVTAVLGAANDNIFKNAMAILVLYVIADQSPVSGSIVVTVATAIFILPFFLFSATAGNLADKYDKSLLCRYIKFAEIVIMCLGATALMIGDTYFLLIVLFLMGTQSSFFGPVKYSILPALLHERELIGGNAIVEAGTFLAILIGTITGALLITGGNGAWTVGVILLVLAILGWISSFQIPRLAASQPNLSINPNFISETLNVVQRAKKKRAVFLSILGISWFWLSGATVLTQYPNYAKLVLNADNYVVTLFLVVTSIGIGVGSLLCNALLKGEISAQFAPLAAFGMSLFLGDLWLASPHTAPSTTVGLGVFLQTFAHWRILVDLLGAAISGGIFVVPLYAIMQHRSDETERSRVIAGNNVLNSLFIVAGALLASAMLVLNFPIPDIFLVLAISHFLVAIYICKLLPETVIKSVLAAAFRFLYGVEIRGAENYVAAGNRAVVIANHVSWLDGLLIASLLPGKPTFAIYTHTATQWWMKPFLSLIDFFPIDPTNPHSLKSLINVMRSEDRRCVIFPEGRITVTGALMKVYEGPGLLAEKANAPIIPGRIDGAQYSTFSRLKGKTRTQLFPKITITILPPRNFELPKEIRGRQRRNATGLKLYDLMTDVIFDTCNTHKSLFDAMADAARIHGHSFNVIEDIERSPINYRRLILSSYILGQKFANLSEKRESVGILLPNSSGVVVTFFSLQAFGRVPAMLDFSTGMKNILSAIATAQIRTVVTSRRFIKLGQLEEIEAALARQVTLVYLEDLRESTSLFNKMVGFFKSSLPKYFHKHHQPDSEDAAVVLFTSGSEGTPKGVVLSHHNILSNVAQLTARVDFNSTDVVFNTLPVFHSFGLSCGTILPILSGVKTFLYPSPLHYGIIPALVYGTNATIMFGTGTFLTGYARASHAYDFYSIRYVFSGAEKLKEETRNTWVEKFGIRILEGYGTTETSPALTTNTPMHYRGGTVGRFLPGIKYELQNVPGIERGGRLVVEGPNVMLGYLKADSPGVLQPPPNGRYDTGDIVSVDDEGFVTIEGRATRFAKIAGQIVSLTAVEDLATSAWSTDEYINAAITVPDPRKGEQIILITNNPVGERSTLVTYAQTNGIPELFLPRHVEHVKKIPILRTGKIDYVTLNEIATGLNHYTTPPK